MKRILHLTYQLPLKVLENVFLHQIKVLCEQPRELTHDFFRLCLMLSGLGNFVVDCHI